MKKTFAATFVAMAVAMSANAIRPLHKLFPVKQSDGTTLMLYKHGNDHLAFYSTADDKVVVPNESGTLCYAVLKDGKLVASDVVVSNVENRSAAEISFLASNQLTVRDAALTEISRRSPYRVSAKIGASTADGLGKYGTSAAGKVPSVGNVTIPVIMVEYTDTKFQETTTIEKLDRFLNQEGYNEDNSYERGSVKDYFVDQSRGLFVPTFDVVAKVTLPNGYAYYGKNYITAGNDLRAIQMVRDAVSGAVSQGVDFSKYYVDGKVPNVIVYYAGCGEATGGDANTIWPHELDLNVSLQTMSNYQFGSYFVGNELNGSETDYELMGMGVLVHEFSHALGLPDFYCTDDSYDGNYAYGQWSVMELGPYTNGAYAPMGYSAYERSFMGWLDIKELSDAEAVTLTNPNETEGQFAAMFRNPSNEKEYFILENRQNGTWGNSYSGLMLHRFAYNANTFISNTVNNNENYKRAMLVAASGAELSSSMRATDLYGNGVNNITSYTLFDDSKYTEMPIYKIIQQPDGTITFNVKDRTLTTTPVVNNSDVYEKVLDASTLAADDEIILVNENDGVSLASDIYSGNIMCVSVKVEDGKVYGNDYIMPLKLRASGSSWSLRSNKAYLTALGSGLKLNSTMAKGSIATISITDGNATITFGGTASRKNLGYDADNVYFATFIDAQNNLQIYRKSTDATAISNISNDQATRNDGKMYNLSGQQVGNNYKGIVIINGKKMLKK